MARDLRVNAVPSREPEGQQFEGFPRGRFEWERPDGGAGGRTITIGRPETVSAPARQASFGTCLYLGPRGQRCDLPALEGGFCSKHRPGATSGGISLNKRVLAAVAAVLGILWPYVADIVRMIIHWFQHH